MKHYLRMMQGLGDTVYQRPFLREAGLRGDELHVFTSWPQLLADIPGIRLYRDESPLRTQKANREGPAAARLYQRGKVSHHFRPWTYATNRFDTISMALQKALPLGAGQSWRLDLPSFAQHLPRAILELRRPFVMVRPATIRREWRADNRNPRRGYLATVAHELRRDFAIVSVAAIDPPHEWLADTEIVSDLRFERGELGVEALMAVTEAAAGIVGGVGWIVPASIAYRRPALIVCGGQGANNAPERLVDERIAWNGLRFAVPDLYCRCSSHAHDCDRRITRIEEHVHEWRQAVGL